MKLRKSREVAPQGPTAPDEVPAPDHDPELQRLLDEEDALRVDVSLLPTLTRRDLAKALTENYLVPALGVPFAQRQEDARLTLDFIENTIADALVAGRTVQLGGFLKLEPAVRPARRGRNPRTGQPTDIPAKRYVKVKVLTHLANRVRDGA